MSNAVDLGNGNDLPCTDKLAFETKKQAETAATVADFQRDVQLGTYKCRDCGLWHLKTLYAQ